MHDLTKLRAAIAEFWEYDDEPQQYEVSGNQLFLDGEGEPVITCTYEGDAKNVALLLNSAVQLCDELEKAKMQIARLAAQLAEGCHAHKCTLDIEQRCPIPGKPEDPFGSPCIYAKPSDWIMFSESENAES